MTPSTDMAKGFDLYLTNTFTCFLRRFCLFMSVHKSLKLKMVRLNGLSILGTGLECVQFKTVKVGE